MEDKFIVLKHSMIRRTDMTMQEKIIYLEILNLSSLEKGCIASNNHFEQSFGISKKSVSNTISSLIKKGFIESELSNRNHTRILSIKDGGVSIKDGGVSIKDGETKENIQDNKTYIYDSLKTKYPFIDEDSFNKLNNHLKSKYKDVTKTRLSNNIKKLLEHKELFSLAVDTMIELDYSGLFVPSKKNTNQSKNKEWGDTYDNSDLVWK